MEGSFVSASIQPPADDGANPSSYPSWILLDNRARFADLDNATTMKAKANTGHEVKVTFCLAEPPAVSYCCVHCPETTEARVVSSANELVLLCVAFRTVPRSTEKDSHFLEYFVYKAASGGNQSIRTIPCSSPTYRDSWHAAILPCEGDHFLVADLVRNEDLVHYDLHMFSSETNEWSTTRLKLQTPPDVLPRNLPSQTDKVISLGGSMVGWVDLWCGILVCDVLEKEPGLRLIPLPKGDSDQQDRLVRDVMGFPNGLINFIEIEHCSKWFNFTKMRRFKTTSFLDFLDTIQDSEILSDDEMLVMDDGLKSVDDGWKIRTCFRSISSDHWRKRHIVHVDDISADAQHSVLVPQLWDSRARKCILRNLKTTAGIPTFSIYNDNVVCLKVASRDEDAWTIGVDLGKKKLEVIKPCCDASLDQTFLPCEFSEYLNTTPRPYVEEVAVDCAQTGAPNDHLLLSNTIPGADTAQTGVANNMQQKMNGDNYYGSYKQYGYGTYPGCGNFQQASPLQPPLTQAVQLMSSSARLEGFIYARLTEPDNSGRMSSVPLNEIYKPTTLSLPPPHRCLQCQGSHLWPNWCGPANPSRQQ